MKTVCSFFTRFASRISWITSCCDSLTIRYARTPWRFPGRTAVAVVLLGLAMMLLGRSQTRAAEEHPKGSTDQGNPGGTSRQDSLKLTALPLLPEELSTSLEKDWLVVPIDQRAGIYRTSSPREIVMTNGLIRRTWRLAPNAATVGFDNLVTCEALLRGVKPEARLQIEGKDFNVGGLQGQPNYAFLRPEWLETMTADPAAFQLAGFQISKTRERFPWKRVRYAADLPWPPPGIALALHFRAPAGSNLDKVRVSVHYEMYDGIPLLCKWLTLENGGTKPVRLQKFTSEILAVVESESVVENQGHWQRPNLHVESDYSFCGMAAAGANQTTQWLPDPQYITQVNYERTTPCLLESRPPIGPDQVIESGQKFESFRTFELALDSSERERRGLALRRMYRTIAPWVTENPILMHVTSTDPRVVKTAIDQCAEVGFEMVILSFGSGLNMEDPAPANQRRMKELADYAHAKGIEMGGYSLLASRSVSPEMDVINPKTGRTGGAVFGNSPCLGSPWGRQYLANLRSFLANTGMTVLEHDGSYPGDVCASTRHPGHRGLEDSQWQQWRAITDFYQGCRGQGIYLNVPDFYFLAGSNKTGMGYRETNWSLPRAQQLIHARQNIYDGTWEKTPSMGWMFVPLVQYQGGGAAATLEPLSEHLPEYRAHLANLFGAGVQACYRGWRLYDTDATKAVVRRWASFYKCHRAILDSDIIHVRRADGRDIDGLLHVNPRLKTKGLAMVYNPLDHPVKRTLLLPLYYTGLTDTAAIRREEGPPVEYKIDHRFRVELPIELPAGGVTWFLVE